MHFGEFLCLYVYVYTFIYTYACIFPIGIANLKAHGHINSGMICITSDSLAMKISRACMYIIPIYASFPRSIDLSIFFFFSISSQPSYTARSHSLTREFTCFYFLFSRKKKESDVFIEFCIKIKDGIHASLETYTFFSLQTGKTCVGIIFRNNHIVHIHAKVRKNLKNYKFQYYWIIDSR